MYRTGAVGALLDLYEKALEEFKKVIAAIPDDALPISINPHDEKCKSLQAILSHVVYSGYGYAASIYELKGNPVKLKEKRLHLTIADYLQDLTDVFIFTEAIFKTIADEELEQLNNAYKITTGWGQLYDIEQLTEHAIVHILRHKRQIGRIMQQRRTNK